MKHNVDTCLQYELKQEGSKLPCFTSVGNVNFVDSNVSQPCRLENDQESAWVLLWGLKGNLMSRQITNTQSVNNKD